MISCDGAVDETGFATTYWRHFLWIYGIHIAFGALWRRYIDDYLLSAFLFASGGYTF